MRSTLIRLASSSSSAIPNPSSSPSTPSTTLHSHLLTLLRSQDPDHSPQSFFYPTITPAKGRSPTRTSVTRGGDESGNGNENSGDRNVNGDGTVTGGSTSTAYLALRCFNAETAMIREKTKGHQMMGRMRFAWWRSAIGEVYKGRPPPHPIAIGLHRGLTLSRSTGEGFEERWFHEMLDAREQNLLNPIFPDLPSFLRYSEATAGSILMLQLQLLLSASSRLVSPARTSTFGGTIASSGGLGLENSLRGSEETASKIDSRTRGNVSKEEVPSQPPSPTTTTAPPTPPGPSSPTSPSSGSRTPPRPPPPVASRSSQAPVSSSNQPPPPPPPKSPTPSIKRPPLPSFISHLSHPLGIGLLLRSLPFLFAPPDEQSSKNSTTEPNPLPASLARNPNLKMVVKNLCDLAEEEIERGRKETERVLKDGSMDKHAVDTLLLTMVPTLHYLKQLSGSKLDYNVMDPKIRKPSGWVPLQILMARWRSMRNKSIFDI